MTKKITQETFDEVIRENIEEFDQTDADALIDTINQFTKQGVDLSNIDTSGGIGREEMLKLIKDLESMVSRQYDANGIDVLDKISVLCQKDNELYRRNQMLMKEKGGLNVLHVMFDKKRNSVQLKQVMSLLNDLSKSNGAKKSSLRTLAHCFISQRRLETFLSLEDAANCAKF